MDRYIVRIRSSSNNLRILYQLLPNASDYDDARNTGNGGFASSSSGGNTAKSGEEKDLLAKTSWTPQTGTTMNGMSLMNCKSLQSPFFLLRSCAFSALICVNLILDLDWDFQQWHCPKLKKNLVLSWAPGAKELLVS